MQLLLGRWSQMQQLGPVAVVNAGPLLLRPAEVALAPAVWDRRIPVPGFIVGTWGPASRTLQSLRNVGNLSWERLGVDGPRHEVSFEDVTLERSYPLGVAAPEPPREAGGFLVSAPVMEDPRCRAEVGEFVPIPFGELRLGEKSPQKPVGRQSREPGDNSSPREERASSDPGESSSPRKGRGPPLGLGVCGEGSAENALLLVGRVPRYPRVSAKPSRSSARW